MPQTQNAWRQIIYASLVRVLPRGVQQRIGGSEQLARLRNWFFRPTGSAVNATVTIRRGEKTFLFTAALQTAHKAAERGIENTICRLIEAYCGAGMTCLDVGANYGYLTLVMARRVEPDGRVLSFEPNPDVFATLRHNVQQNGLSAVCLPFNVAVSDHPASGIPLFTSTTTSHLADGDEAASTLIDIVTLDGVIQQQALTRVDLIKIDVDGIEYEIVRGALQTIRTHRPVMIIEANRMIDEMVQFLMECGYNCYTLNGQSFVMGSAYSSNIVACQPEQLKKLWPDSHG